MFWLHDFLQHVVCVFCLEISADYLILQLLQESAENQFWCHILRVQSNILLPNKIDTLSCSSCLITAHDSHLVPFLRLWQNSNLHIARKWEWNDHWCCRRRCNTISVCVIFHAISTVAISRLRLQFQRHHSQAQFRRLNQLYRRRSLRPSLVSSSSRDRQQGHRSVLSNHEKPRRLTTPWRTCGKRSLEFLAICDNVSACLLSPFL